jgi:hypothetical protein
MSRAAFVPLLLLAVACTPADTQTDRTAAGLLRVGGVVSCDDPQLMSGAGVGPVAVGRLISAVRQDCEVVRDTLELDAEAAEQRVAYIRVAGDTVLAPIVDARIRHIEVATPRIRTTDSLGVGSSLGDLRHIGALTPMLEHAGLYVQIPNQCGVAYRLDYSLNQAGLETPPSRILSSLSDTILVDQVLISGCR